MASRKQEELPNTRRDDEPEPPKPIKALDDACAEFDKQIQDLLRKHELSSYVYEDAKGIEREVFREEVVRTRKVKTETSGDDE